MHHAWAYQFVHHLHPCWQAAAAAAAGLWRLTSECWQNQHQMRLGFACWSIMSDAAVKGLELGEFGAQQMAQDWYQGWSVHQMSLPQMLAIYLLGTLAMSCQALGALAG